MTEIQHVLHEDRLFPPSPEFSAKSRIGSLQEYQELYDRAAENPVEFWAELARKELHWFQDFTEGMVWNEPFVEWFVGGKTNASYNCLDAHLNSETRDRKAIIWEGEPGDVRTLTYAELHEQVCKFANVLKSRGVGVGDVVSIYMPMVPELAITMLACARIGAVHSVIFGGFSAEAIADRNHDAQAKIQVTADGGWRRGKVLPLKETVDEALEKSSSVETCIVLRRTENEVAMKEGRDFWWHELMAGASAECPAEPLDSETPLFILYTSGSTGKPKGIKHTTAGYNLYAKMSFRWVFDW
ncbi:MAG: AMP-binding protein, partial [Pirellulaceae bacterium]|nr:AMP-binding protein [Pirellulaceae bacterium]